MSQRARAYYDRTGLTWWTETFSNSEMKLSGFNWRQHQAGQVGEGAQGSRAVLVSTVV